MAQLLLIEDNLHNQELFVTALTHYGHDVTVAEDGEKGLKLIDKLRPDLVLLDLSIPKIDGWTVAKTVRKHSEPAVARIKILALTAHAMKGDQERALAAGCDEYLAKPVSPRELGRRVRAILDQAKAA